MEFWDGFDLGFEQGSWYGYLFAIERLKQLRLKREALIVSGTLLVSVVLTLIAANGYSRINEKRKKKKVGDNFYASRF